MVKGKKWRDGLTTLSGVDRYSRMKYQKLVQAMQDDGLTCVLVEKL